MRIQASTAWELDFWGRFRRATESARAQLLATEWGRRAVLTTIVSQVADGYFALRALDLQLDISRRTLASRQQSLQLTQVRERGGATSLVDVREAEQLVFGAGAAIADLERRIAQQENFISILLGNFPSPITRGLELIDQPHPPVVPAGLPSDLLGRRPDILAAEQQIVAANAQIGVARAAYFPSISLTGNGGVQSAALGALFGAGAGFWTAAVGAAQPISPPGGRGHRSPSPRRAPRRRRWSIRRPSRARSGTPPMRSSATARPANSAGSSNPLRPPPRMRAVSPTSATRAAPPAISKCWTPTPGCSPRNSGSPTHAAASCPPSSSCIARWGAAGSRKVCRRANDLHPAAGSG